MIKLPQSGDAVKIIDKTHFMFGKQGIVQKREYDKCGLVSVKFTDGLKRFMLPNELEVEPWPTQTASHSYRPTSSSCKSCSSRAT